MELNIFMVIFSIYNFFRAFVVIVINMRIRYCVCINSRANTESLCDHTLEKRESEYIKWAAEHHVIRANYVVHVKSAANYVYCISKWAGDIFFRCSPVAVVLWVPGNYYAMARARFFF